VHHDISARVGALERCNSHLVFKKNFGEDVDDAFGVMLRADSEAGALLSFCSNLSGNRFAIFLKVRLPVRTALDFSPYFPG
jgi:hypothetical protein